ncbi:MAG: endonuclease [Prevotella sp.]|nr:endonuclease [Prevotella sp.]
MIKKLFLRGIRRSIMLVSFLMLAMVAFAVPAKPGLTRLLTLTGGTTVSATLVGDEYAHFWLGADGKSYQAVPGTDVYQEVNRQTVVQRAQQRRSQANQHRTRRLAPRRVGTTGAIVGQKKGLIILVNFSDATFKSANNNALYQRIANEENFSYGNFKGSMYDYFKAQSEGQFLLTFDVVGPVTVSKTYLYYGSNDNEGNDKHPAEMVIEALKLADSQVNFADYDWDGDGEVDQVYVVYAGEGEADGGAANTIWPHEWQLSEASYYGDGSGRQRLDNVYIDTYACGAELDGQAGSIAGIGTMCHEFSHCLGYPDFYDTDYSGGQGMGYWDLMDGGSYNGDGFRPAGYTSYERWVAGWKTPIELLNSQSVINVAALQTNGSNTYIIYNKGNNNEYFLLENRQQIGWDSDIPGSGLLILHVDYDATVWANNTPNDTPSRQRMTWIAADNNYQYTTYNGTKYYTEQGMANDPYPYRTNNTFSRTSTPAAKLYNKNIDDTYYLDSSVENIKQNSDGTVSFSFVGISNVATPVFSPAAGRYDDAQQVTISCATEGAIIYYTLDGTEPAATSTAYTAPLTISETTTVKAVAIKDGEQSAVATARYTIGDLSKDDFILVTSASEFEEGDYIIVYNNGALNTTISSDRLQYTEVTPEDDVITTTDASIIWHIARSGNYYTIYNAGENKFAASNGVKNKAQLLASCTDDKALWTVTPGATFEFINKYNSGNGINANLRRNGTYGFACYSTSTGGALSLYKRADGSTTPADPATAYYQKADGKQGTALKTAMSGIIYNHTEKSYEYLWTAFQTTDVRSDGKIWDMYSDITNFSVQTSGSNYTQEGDCYNREHAFPQSWFDDNLPMKTDLHHVYPTDGYVNNRRSNNPYGETNGEKYQSANGFSKVGICTYPGYTGTVFEPNDEYKGDLARAVFYMVTCYEEKLPDWYSQNTASRDVLDGKTYPGLAEWQLNMLMEWAKNDPVSEKEINRNNAVYAIQGNRNPFVDYPGLEEYIWGTMTSTAFSYDNYVQPVYKQNATMSFSPASVTVVLGESFTEPTLTTRPSDLTVAYSSSNPAVASVDAATGEVTVLATGTTVITATFAGNDSYNAASASYTLTVREASPIEDGNLLYEGVTSYDSNGDSSTDLTIESGNLDYNGWSSISKVFAGGTDNAYSNGGCLKFGSSKAAGSMTTGSIALTGKGTLTFYLKQYSAKDGGVLNVTVEGAEADMTEFTPTAEWTLCTVNLTNATGYVTITLATSTKRAYVDEITLVAKSPTTGITTTDYSTVTNGNAWYDLNGRRLLTEPAAKGIYIVNGRKVVVK